MRLEMMRDATIDNHLLAKVATFLFTAFIVQLAGVRAAEFPGKPTDWHGFDRYEFKINENTVSVVAPKQTAPGKPWVWHGEFFGHRPEPDIKLLEKGFHVVYLRVPNMLGSPQAVEHWNNCYAELTKTYQLASKVALVGLSRGGLYCYNWAIANPEKVACIYGDAPVCDFKSWPGGKSKGSGIGPGSASDWALVLQQWKFSSDAEAVAYKDNPVDRLQPLAEAGIPLLHVFGDADEVVPWEENTGLIAERYPKLGGHIELIRKPGVKHHPHGLEDPTPIVDFILRHARPPVEGNESMTLTKTNSTDEKVTRFELKSPYQPAPTFVDILYPTSATGSAGTRLPVVFLLPVEARRENRWGDCLKAAQEADLANRLGSIVVCPTFEQLPWYADHATNPAIRQESHLIQALLPALRWQLSNARHDRDSRTLIGFSKSGYGAWSLLLRHSQLFGKAVAWDAPLMMDKLGKYGTDAIYGSEDNFQHYRLTKLLELKADELSKTNSPRLYHLGYGNFKQDHEAMESRLQQLRIPHHYQPDPQRQHHWQSGWLSDAAKLLEGKD